MDEEDKRHEVCAVEGISSLYISDWVGAGSVNENNILGITHILSVMTATDLEQYGPDENPDVELRHLDLKDEPSADLLRHLMRECNWLDATLSQPKNVVLIHCQQGVSRSAAVAVAYLIRKRQLTFDQALASLKNSRSIINMNPGFVRQLKAWERDIRDSKADDQMVSPTTPKTPIVVLDPVDFIDWKEGPGSSEN